MRWSCRTFLWITRSVLLNSAVVSWHCQHNYRERWSFEIRAFYYQSSQRPWHFKKCDWSASSGYFMYIFHTNYLPLQVEVDNAGYSPSHETGSEHLLLFTNTEVKKIVWYIPNQWKASPLYFRKMSVKNRVSEIQGNAVRWITNTTQRLSSQSERWKALFTGFVFTNQHCLPPRRWIMSEINFGKSQCSHADIHSTAHRRN